MSRMNEDNPGICMRAFLDVRGKDTERSAYVHHVKPEGFASYRLEHVIYVGLFQRGSIHGLYVRKVAHELEANAQ